MMQWYVRYKVFGFEDETKEYEIGPFDEQRADLELSDLQGYPGVCALYKISEEHRAREQVLRAEEIRRRTSEPPTGYWSPEE